MAGAACRVLPRCCSNHARCPWVKMVTHPTIGVYLPAGLLTPLRERLQQPLPILVILERSPPASRPIHHLIDRPSILSAQLPSHAPHLPIVSSRVDQTSQSIKHYNRINWVTPASFGGAWAAVGMTPAQRSLNYGVTNRNYLAEPGAATVTR